MVNKMKQLVMEEEGQGLSEYGLILAGVVVVAVAVVGALTGALDSMFKTLTALIKA
jgi:pilus assembly protein Flp/PilA